MPACPPIDQAGVDRDGGNFPAARLSMLAGIAGIAPDALGNQVRFTVIRDTIDARKRVFGSLREGGLLTEQGHGPQGYRDVTAPGREVPEMVECPFSGYERIRCQAG